MSPLSNTWRKYYEFSSSWCLTRHQTWQNKKYTPSSNRGIISTTVLIPARRTLVSSSEQRSTSSGRMCVFVASSPRPRATAASWLHMLPRTSPQTSWHRLWTTPTTSVFKLKRTKRNINTGGIKSNYTITWYELPGADQGQCILITFTCEKLINCVSHRPHIGLFDLWRVLILLQHIAFTSNNTVHQTNCTNNIINDDMIENNNR